MRINKLRDFPRILSDLCSVPTQKLSEGKPAPSADGGCEVGTFRSALDASKVGGQRFPVKPAKQTPIHLQTIPVSTIESNATPVATLTKQSSLFTLTTLMTLTTEPSRLRIYAGTGWAILIILPIPAYRITIIMNTKECNDVFSGENTNRPLEPESHGTPPTGDSKGDFGTPTKSPARGDRKDEGEGKKAKKLSGMQRTRLNKLLKFGHNKEVAMKMVEEESRPDNKRPRSVTTPEDNSKRAKKEGLPEEEAVSATPMDKPPSYASALKHTLVAICHQDYPCVLLTTSDMDLISEEIIDAIVDLNPEDPPPQFDGTTYKPGYLSVRCTDQDTTNWLTKVASNIKVGDSAPLKAIVESLLPHPKRAVVTIPNGAKWLTPKIMKLLENQNSGINFGAWRLMHRINRIANVLMIWSIDVESAETLNQRDCKLFIGLGRMARVYLKDQELIDDEQRLIQNIDALELEKNKQDAV